MSALNLLEEVATGIVVAAVSWVLMSLLNRRKARIFEYRGNPEGLFWSGRYRYGPHILLTIAFVIALAVAIYVTRYGVYAGRENEGALGVVFVFLLFSPLAYFPFFLTIRPPPRLSPEGLVRTRYSGRTETIPWSKVYSVHYSDWFITAYVIRTERGNIWLNTGLDGLQKFLDDLRQHVPNIPFMDRSLDTLTRMAFTRRKRR